jgi:hypothetical protein
LRKELSSGSDKESVDDFLLAVLEQAGEGSFLAREVVHGSNGGQDVFDVLAVWLNVVNDSDNLPSLLPSTFESEPSRRFGEGKGEDDDDDRKDTGGHAVDGQPCVWKQTVLIDSPRQTPVPGSRSVDLRESKGEPRSHGNTGSDTDTVNDDVVTSFVDFAGFGLPDRNGRGHHAQTCAKYDCTSAKCGQQESSILTSRNDQLSQAERGTLKDGTGQSYTSTDQDGKSSTELVSQVHRAQTSDSGTQVEA